MGCKLPAMNFPLNHADLETGLDLFNRGHFFEAHEVLEDLWRALARDHPTRRHHQGMVQLAVAFHHQSTGNHIGARSVLERALRNLNGGDSSFPELDLDRLRAELEPWRRYLELSNAASGSGGRDAGRQVKRPATPELPRIMRRS